MDSDDSCSDLFITQSCFRTNVDTQGASDAVNFLNGSFDLLQDNSGEVIEYWDFSKENSNNKSSPQMEEKALDKSKDDNVPEVSNVEVGKEPFLPLVPDLFDDHDVDKVSDDVLSAALDSVTAELVDTERFGAPVLSNEVTENSGKGCVFLVMFTIENFFLFPSISSMVSNCRYICIFHFA